MVSEIEREKSHTICHIREQTCSMTARSLAQLYYIYNITSTCLPYCSERRSRKPWELVAPSSQQSSDVTLAIKKFLRFKEKRLSLCVHKSVF